METWKKQLEGRFADFSLAIMKRPKLSLLIFLGVLIAFGQNLRFLEMDPEMENFVDPDTEVRQIYTQAKDEFGRNDILMLAFRGDVISEDFIRDLTDVQAVLETDIPYVNEVTSILNAPYQKGSEDALEVLDLVEGIPTSQADLDQIEQRIQESSLASTILVNDARTLALVMVEPDTVLYGDGTAEADPFADDFSDAFSDDVFFDDAFSEDTFNIKTSNDETQYVGMFEIRDMLIEVDGLLADYQHLDPMIAGVPALNYYLEGTMQSEMLFFIRLTVVLMIITLIAFFRQPNAVIAPIFAVLSALLITMSTLVMLGNKVQVPLILVPSFLLAITIGDAVHLLTHFYRKIQLGEARIKAMKHAVERTSIPMLLTSLTTAGGLLSLSIADVVPIRNLGIFAAYGVILAFVLTITVIPALVMLLPMRQVKQGAEHRRLANAIHKAGEFSWRHGGKIAIIWLIAFGLSLTQIVRLEFSHDPLNWMPRDLAIVDATQTIDQELSGTMTLDVIFDTGEANGAKDLDFLTQMAAWQDELDTYSQGAVEVKGTSSIIDILRESNRALQGGSEEFYRLPETQSLVNEELFLFENSAADTLYQMVDSDFQKTKMSLVLPWGDMMFYEQFVSDVTEQGQAQFESQANVEVTGMIALMAGTMVKLVYDTSFSYLIAAGVISVMMMLLLSSVHLGLIAMIPNIAPIAVVMGLMKPFGIELDMLTILVATIAIGIAVDNTVHFTHHFRHGLEQGHDVHDAILDAFAGAGQALFTTSIVLSAGFYVFLFSDVSSIFNLGFLCGTAFILAMVSNFTLTPYLLRWYYRNHDAHNPESQTA